MFDVSNVRNMFMFIVFGKHLQTRFYRSDNFNKINLRFLSAPKKCAHVLKTLLNYLHYVEMVKKEVCESTDTMLDTYNDVLTEKTSLQTRNESAKQRSDTVSVQQFLKHF